ncbi:MAG: DUF3822 family protein [Bacteroidetes bacterium]|nr:DUF3822 family protein [Bacteroidota bacterium]
MQVLKPNISLIDDAFKVNEVENNRLFISISFNGISYSIINNANNQFFVLESYSFQKQETLFQLCENISQISKENPILKQGFNDVTILIQNHKSTLIPNSLFDESNKKQYFEFNQIIENAEDILVDQLANIKAVNLFAINQSLLQNLKNNFPKAKIIHSSTALIESLFIINKTKSAIEEVYLNIQSNYFEIIYFKDSKLQLNNNFNYKTAEDFAYYLLFAFEQLQIKPDEIKVTLLGEIEKDSAIYEYLFKYIMNIEFISRNEKFNYSEKIQSLPSHYFYLLLNSATCV